MFSLKLIIQNWWNRFLLRRNSEKVSAQVHETSVTSVVISTFSKLFVLCLFGVVILFPFFMMISISLMTDNEAEILKNNFLFFTKFENGNTVIDGTQHNVEWKEVVQNTFHRAFSYGYWSSILFTSLNVLISVVLKVFITIFMGYAFSLRNWRGKNLVWFIALSLLVLPEVALLSGQVRVVKQLNLNSTYVGFLFTVAVPFVASVFNATMYKNAFESIPGRIKEVALIDGAVGAKYLFKIAIPMVVPTTFTIVILTALASWNAYLWPITIATDTNDVQVISVWLFRAGIDPNVTGESGNIVYQNVKMAAAIIAILPMFIVYLLFRKSIMRAISRQGSTIKG